MYRTLCTVENDRLRGNLIDHDLLPLLGIDLWELGNFVFYYILTALISCHLECFSE